MRARRILLTTVLTAGLGTAVVAGTAAPASASYTQVNPVIWAYTDSHDPMATFIKRPGDSPVGTRLDGGVSHTSRFYFGFDLSALKGQTIHQDYLYSIEKSVVDCSAAAPLELWRTSEITDQTSWRRPLTELQRLNAATRGDGKFCPAYFITEVMNAVNAALARGDKRITFELRVASAQESDPRLGRTFGAPWMSVEGNHPPVISNPAVAQRDPACGTRQQPTVVPRSARLSASVSDVDNDLVSGTFAIWPLAHPDQRQEFPSPAYGGGFIAFDPDFTGYPDGGVLAWQARAYDQRDYSTWTQPCYVVLDKTPPAKAPVVSSAVYPSDRLPHGGPGVPGKFRFDAQGDKDVVAYGYTDNERTFGTVKARYPGGPAVITYTPTRDGPMDLYVTSIDAAGNRGPTNIYEIFVAFTAPYLQVDVGGVNVPSHLTFQSTVSGVTSFGYRVDGGTEVKVPAPNGSATADVTFTHAGIVNLTTKTYVKNTMVGSTTQQVYVDDAPGVTSNDFSFDHDGMLGQTGTFTFHPRTTNVVAYLYSFDGDQQRIDAAADGTAVLTWTPPYGGWYDLYVQSVQADGTTSAGTDYQFGVVDPHPSVYSDTLVIWPRIDGVGVPVDIEFSDALYGGVTGYVYNVDGGPQQTIAADSGYARFTVTPDRAGRHTIMVYGQLSGGGVTPTTTWTFQITSAPLVTWVEFPGGTGGQTGEAGTFSFKPGLPNVAGYHYTFQGDQERTVTAAADGSATVSYTPTYAGYQTVNVYSVSADGTVSDTRMYQFIVRDPRVWVYGGYDSYTARGGIGVPAQFGFYTQLFPDVVEYRYQLNGGPTQTVSASTAGTTTYVWLAPDRNGSNVLTVQSVTAAGDLSPVTEYDFLVGTAPLVTSAQYPTGTWGGGVGVAGTFVFSGGTAGIVAFDYQFDNGTSGSVDADSTGTGSVSFTPTAGGYQSVTVHGRRADGSSTDSTTYSFLVQ